jgi:hypothetical protein
MSQEAIVARAEYAGHILVGTLIEAHAERGDSEARLLLHRALGVEHQILAMSWTSMSCGLQSVTSRMSLRATRRKRRKWPAWRRAVPMRVDTWPVIPARSQSGRRIQLKRRAGYSATPRTHASAGQGLRDDPIHYRIDPTARSTVGD